MMRFQQPVWHEVLSSTNTTLAARLRQGENLEPGYLIAAREQTAGRGRFERRWASRAGRDLTFSFVCQCSGPPLKALSLPMAAALGVRGLLHDYGVSANTKWPNDVLVARHKICGILAETVRRDRIVVGIGLNVNMSAEEAADINQPATSLAIETGQDYDVEQVLESLLPHLAEWIDRWEANGFLGLKAAWTQHCLDIAREITVREAGQQIAGRLLGFGDSGQLLMQDASGQQREIWAGDVTM